MKRINIIFHELTLLNFPLLGSLFKRYWIISLLTPLFYFSLSYFLYSSQRYIYKQSAGFKVVGEESSNPNDLMTLLGKEKEVLTIVEIRQIAYNWRFYKKLAEKLYSLPDFSELNFNRLNSRKNISHRDLFSACRGDKECITDKITRIVWMFYEIESTPASHTYVLHVSTLDRKTTSHVLKNVVALINEERMMHLKVYTDQKIERAKDLLEKKKNELNEKGVLEIVREIGKVEPELMAIQKKSDEFQRNMMIERQNIATYKTMVETTEAYAPNNINTYTDGKTNYKIGMKLEKEIFLLKSNIKILEGNKNISKDDMDYLAILKSELKLKEKKYSKINSGYRSVAAQQKFEESQKESLSGLKFKLKVSEEKLKKLSDEYTGIEEDRSKVLAKLAKLNDLKARYEPDVKYLGVIKSKLTSLELLGETITSDLLFDDINPKQAVFKRSSKSKVFGLGVVLSIITTIFLLLFKYVLDDVIYTEEELKEFFKEIEIIGRTPEFD